MAGVVISGRAGGGAVDGSDLFSGSRSADLEGDDLEVDDKALTARRSDFVSPLAGCARCCGNFSRRRHPAHDQKPGREISNIRAGRAGRDRHGSAAAGEVSDGGVRTGWQQHIRDFHRVLKLVTSLGLA